MPYFIAYLAATTFPDHAVSHTRDHWDDWFELCPFLFCYTAVVRATKCLKDMHWAKPGTNQTLIK